MSKRTKIKLRNFGLYLIKYVFNSRYIVRNILAATILCTFVAAVCGIVSVNSVSQTAEEEGATEAVAVINMQETPQMNLASVNILMAGLDTDTQTDIRPNETQVVTEPNAEIFVVTAEDGIFVRAAASTDAEIVGSLYMNDTGSVLAEEGDWLYINVYDITGYVKAEFVLTGDDARAYIEQNQADENTEDEQEAAGMNKADKDEKEDKAETSDASQTTEQQSAGAGTTTTPATETTENTTETQPAAPVTSGGSTVGITYRSPVTLSEADINLMASVMTLECGAESYEGQLAVANVILNRYLSGAYGSTMSDVCYAPNQFSVVSLPSFQSYVQNGAQASCLQAAREALSGVNNIGSYTQFRPVSNVNPDNFSSYTIIGNHIFF